MTAAEQQAALDQAVTPLQAFVCESNRIEGIERDPLTLEIRAHQELLAEPEMSVGALELFVIDVAARPLRDTVGMDVRVGAHFPPPGGPTIRTALEALVHDVNACELTPFEAHVAYETLHPFLDGNGRSGRALWAWQMRRDGLDPFALGFLHRFYYQALEGGRPGYETVDWREIAASRLDELDTLRAAQAMLEVAVREALTAMTTLPTQPGSTADHPELTRRYVLTRLRTALKESTT